MSEQTAAIQHRGSFILDRVDIWVPSLLGILGLAASVALAVKIPDPTQAQLHVFLVLLALSAGAVAALIPGLLHLKLNAPGLAVRGAGAIGVFCIVFFQPPSTGAKLAQAFSLNTQPVLMASDLTREGNMAMQHGDRDKALSLWRQAAAKGDCIAVGNIASALDGQSRSTDDQAAAGRQYKLAADCGNPTAQLMVGKFYAEGSHGLPQDRAKAVGYYRLAQQSNVPAAIDGLKQLGEQP